MKILIVDDDPWTRTLLTEILTEVLDCDKCEVFSAHSGPAALAFVRESSDLDYILMDYHMPAMDGVACLTAIREMGHLHHTRMILVSAEWAAQKHADHMKIGFVRKPFDLNQLVVLLGPQANPPHPPHGGSGGNAGNPDPSGKGSPPDSGHL